MKFPLVDNVPYVDRPQMIEVDRLMIEAYGIELIQMMENAGRTLAHLARQRFLDGNPRGRRVMVLAGTGGNGGGALVCARRLHNYGAEVHVVTTKPADAYTGVPAHQLEIVRRMQIPVHPAHDLGTDEGGGTAAWELVIDGVIGYSLRGAPRGPAATLIRWANRQDSPILSLDAPSGIDTTSGAVFDPAIRATATMTLALPKTGLRAAAVAAQVGELYLADISVPPELYRSPTLQLAVGHIFAQSDIVRIG